MIFSHCSERIDGFMSIRCFGVGGVFQKSNGNKVDAAHNCCLHVALSENLLAIRLESLANFMIYLMTVVM